MLLDLHTDLSRDRPSGLVFPSPKEFSRVVIHKVKDCGIVNKAEVDIFLKLSCFYDNPMVIGNLISGSSDFSFELASPVLQVKSLPAELPEKPKIIH